MKPFFFGILVLLSGTTAWAQDCNCPAGTGDEAQVLKAFRFSNGKQLGVCGFTTIEGSDTSYTQFSLLQCGDNKPIESWGKDVTCEVIFDKDALLVEEMYNLPVGQSFSTLWRPFYIHKYTFKNGTLEKIAYYNPQHDHYTKEQIADVIQQYNDLPRTPTEETMKVANMLFWATVSGSRETESLLNSIPTKFGPFDNSVLSDEWKAIYAVYSRWKTKGAAK